MKRGILAAFLLAAACAGAKADKSVDRADGAVEKLGARVARDEKTQKKQMIAVSFAYEMTTDADLTHLKELKQLRELNLLESKVTDAGLVHPQ